MNVNCLTASLNSIVKESRMASMELSLVDFYRGAEVFLTGGTGFIGKGISEKLLRSFDVKHLYLLIRPQKSQSPEERLENLKKDAIFDVLRKENPKALDKLIFIPGDVSEKGLGITPAFCQQMVNVSIVIHAAATLRFDEPIQKAILLNVRGTKEILELSIKSLPKLKSILHVSTMYCNPFIKCVQEKIYPARMDWRMMISLAENNSIELLNSLTPKLIANFPNTYTFTKNLAEQIINEYRQQIPVAIVRPSIVCCTSNEPFPSYVDNIVAVNGVFAGAGVGVTRVFKGDPKAKLDYVPLDLVVKSIVLSAWYATLQMKSRTDPVFISNCCLPTCARIQKFLVDQIPKAFEKYPAEIMLWKPNVQVTSSKIYFLILFCLTHLLPALIIDTVLRITGRKPMLMKAQRFGFASTMVISFFTSRTFRFQHENLTKLEEIAAKMKDMKFCEISEIDVHLMIEKMALSSRRHIYKMKDETIPKAKKLHRIFVILDYCLKAAILFVLGKFLLRFS